jgi:hypothetical protein
VLIIAQSRTFVGPFLKITLSQVKQNNAKIIRLIKSEDISGVAKNELIYFLALCLGGKFL